MALPKVDKSKIIEVVDELSDDSLHQLVMFLDYLRFKEQSDLDPSWFKQAFGGRQWRQIWLVAQ